MKFNILNSIFIIALTSYVKANVIDMEDVGTKEIDSQMVMPVTTTKTLPIMKTTNQIIPTTTTLPYKNVFIKYKNIGSSELLSLNTRIPGDVEESIIYCFKGEEIPEGKKAICANDKTCYGYYDKFNNSIIKQVCGIYTHKTNEPTPTEYFSPDDLCRYTEVPYTTLEIESSSYIDRRVFTRDNAFIDQTTYRIIPTTTVEYEDVCKESVTSTPVTIPPPTPITTSTIPIDTPSTSYSTVKTIPVNTKAILPSSKEVKLSIFKRAPKSISTTTKSFPPDVPVTTTLLTLHATWPNGSNAFYDRYISIPKSVNDAIGGCHITTYSTKRNIFETSSKIIPYKTIQKTVTSSYKPDTTLPTSVTNQSIPTTVTSSNNSKTIPTIIVNSNNNLKKRADDYYKCDENNGDCYDKYDTFTDRFMIQQFLVAEYSCSVYTYIGKYNEVSGKIKSLTSICRPTITQTSSLYFLKDYKTTYSSIGEDQYKTVIHETVSPFTYKTSSRYICQTATNTIPITSSKTLPITTTTTTTTTTNAITTKTLPTKCIPEIVTVTVKEKETITVKETVTVTVKSMITPTPKEDKQCATKWAQCGGIGYNGPTCCQSGSTCRELNKYYSQCV